MSLIPAALLALLATGVPLFTWSHLGDQIVLPRLAATGLFTGITAASLPFTAQPWTAIGWHQLRLPLVATAILSLVAAVSTILGIDPVGDLLGEYQRYQGLLPLLAYVLLMFSTMLAVSRRHGLVLITWGIFVGGVLAGGYAVIQRLGLDWVKWEGVDPSRTGGAFAQPDALGIELLAALAISTGLWTAHSGWRRDVVAFGSAVILSGLVFTQSRGAWVGGAAVVLVLLTFHARRREWRAGMVTLILLILASATFVVTVSSGGGVLRQTFGRAESSTNLNDVAVSTRIGLWRTALSMVEDRPLLGSGPDSFSALFPRYRTADQPGIGTENVAPESSHNFFLDQAVGMGLLGASAWALLIGSSVWAAHRAPADRRILIPAITAGLVGYYVSVFFSFADGMTGWLPWILMGMLFGSAGAPPDHSVQRRNRRTTGGRIVKLALVAGGSLVAAGSAVLFLADLDAGRANAAALNGNPKRAEIQARRAYRFNPLQGMYLLDRGSYLERRAATDAGRSGADAASAYAEYNRRFAPTAYSLIAEARVRAMAFNNGGQDDVRRLLEEAASLDPNNEPAARAIAELRASLGNDVPTQ